MLLNASLAISTQVVFVAVVVAALAGMASSSWDFPRDRVQNRGHGKGADQDGNGGGAWGDNGWNAGNSWADNGWDKGKSWADDGWIDPKCWDNNDDNTKWQDRSRGEWQDRSHGASSQSWTKQDPHRLTAPKGQDDKYKTANALSLDAGSAVPKARPQVQFMVQNGANQIDQDVVAEFARAGLAWKESNLEDGPSLDLEYFQNVAVAGSWQINNLALKHLRDQYTARNGKDWCFVEYGLDHSSQSRYRIPNVVHRPNKPDYKFDFGSPMTEWSWHQMIAQLDAHSMEIVVHDGDRSRGITRCSLLGYPSSDMATDRKNRDNMGGRAPAFSEKMFDFAIWRSDGSLVTLHPDFTKTKVRLKKGYPKPDNELPDSGIGGTSGKKTFQRLLMKGVDRLLKFDAAKCMPNPQPQHVAPTQQPPQSSCPPPPPPGGPPRSNDQPPVNAVPVDPDSVPSQVIPHPPQHPPPGVFTYPDGTETGLPPPPPAKASSPSPPGNTAAAVAVHSLLNALTDAPSQSRHTDGIMAPSNALKGVEEIEEELAAATDNLFTFHGGEDQANREEQLSDTIDAAVEAAGSASLSWPPPLPPVVEPTPLSETTPKAPPLMPPQSPRGLQLGPPPLLTPQSRDIAGSPPASSSEEYEHATETEDKSMEQAPAVTHFPPSMEEAPAVTHFPSSMEQAPAVTHVPPSMEQAPALEQEDIEERGYSGDSSCFELVPEPTRPGEATAVLSLVYVKAAEITDISDGP